jgi:nickel-dependent lactate racemase
MTKEYRVPYSKGEIFFNLPDSMRGEVVVSNTFEPIGDVEAAIEKVLAGPTGTPPLHKMVRKGDTVCIIFTDITRFCPEHLIVPVILRELEKAGVHDRDITLLCGIGLHRPSTHEEKIAKLGKDVVARYTVIDNEPLNRDMLVNLGNTPGGVPVEVHRAAVTADFLIATGIVEPHQSAGYSGGRKTVAVGAAGEALIAHTHGPAFLDQPGVRLGRIEGNPLHEAITEAARRAGLRFIVNVVMDDDHRILKVAAGEPEATFHELVSFARSVFEVPIDKQYDVAIGGVGFPKDTNLYQASRAPSYLFFAPTPVVKRGGFIIIPARCEEGAGEGVGEQRFFTAMRNAPNVQYILDDARANGYPPGQQRAFFMAKVLKEVRVIIVGSEHPDIVESCKMIPARTMEEALMTVKQERGADIDALIVPHALLTLPVVTKKDT